MQFLVANDAPGYVTNAPSNLDHLEEEDIPPWDYIDDELRDEIMASSNVEFYLPEDEHGIKELNIIKEHFDSLENAGEFRISVENVDDSTWLNKWKEFFKPLKIGENFYIKPSWEEIKEAHNCKIIEIDPENAFGSGTHATTQLCLMAIEKQQPAGKSVLDLGCGSGILGIGAGLLGADNVTFVDIDSVAVKTTEKNALNNNLNMDTLSFYVGNILEDTLLCDNIGYNQYDTMLVNIIADIIIAMAPMLDKFLKDDGTAIFSGIITQRLDDVLEALTDSGFEVVKVDTMDGWCAVTAKQ